MQRAVEQLRAELHALQNVMHRHDEIITAVLSQMNMVFAGIEGVYGAGYRYLAPAE